MTVILIPRVEGVETRPIKTAYSSTAGTAYVTFDNVKVPVENTLGEEDKGLKVVLRSVCALDLRLVPVELNVFQQFQPRTVDAGLPQRCIA